MTYKELYDEIVAVLGPAWMQRQGIEKETIFSSIDDELVMADPGLLQGEFTGSGDGTNPYLEIDDSLAVVRRVHYGFTSGSDWGDLLEEISPLEETGDIGSGDPTGYWVQSMLRYNKQRIYFDKIPSSSITIRVLFIKWPDSYAEGDTIEFQRLWAKIIKHGVITDFLAKDQRRIGEYNHHLMKKKEAKTQANNLKAMKGTGMTTRFTDA